MVVVVDETRHEVLARDVADARAGGQPDRATGADRGDVIIDDHDVRIVDDLGSLHGNRRATP